MKDKPFSVRLPPGVRPELQAWADEEGRSLANLIDKILRDALQAHLRESAQSATPTDDPVAQPTS
jgi:hypothetical protein